jgi:hypothetical protein
MAGIRDRLDRAAALHREAAAIATAAGAALDEYERRTRSATEERSIRELAERLRAAAALLAPGWLGAPLDAVPASTPLGAATRPELVRIGTAYPLDDASFPVLVPLGNLAIDGDDRDPRVAGALRATLLRLVATARAGSLLVRPVDPAGVVFAPFRPLHDAGIMPPPVTDLAGLQAVLGEAEQWVRDDRAGRERTLLLVVASWPQATDADELARVSALAAAGPAAGLHLLVTGWPPPTLTGDLTGTAASQRLPLATQVTLRNPYALVGHPPGGSFSASVPPGLAPLAGLNAHVYLDEAPPADLIARVCGDVAGQAAELARDTLGELLPAGPFWTGDAAPDLQAVAGRAGDTPVTLRISQLAPHWLIVGEPGSGRSTMLLTILYQLCTMYGPDQLHVFLLDFTGDGTFAELVPAADDPAFLPHARAVGIEPSLADGVAVLRTLVSQLARRAAAGQTLPRLLCMIDDIGPLTGGAGEAAGAGELLESLAQRGGAAGIHLVLAGQAPPPPPVASQCRVRIALPGGAAALDPANHAADELTPGTAVVNTASGLGGPRGATRAHEQLVRFPDLRADRAALAGLRHRLWRAGAEGGRA